MSRQNDEKNKLNNICMMCFHDFYLIKTHMISMGDHYVLKYDTAGIPVGQILAYMSKYFCSYFQLTHIEN